MSLIDKAEFMAFARSLPAASPEFLQALEPVVNAAPTIECAACEYGTLLEREGAIDCREEHHGWWMNPDDSCRHFQRRQP